jgi:5-methylcytosine-specific restriction endonuclease McrA
VSTGLLAKNEPPSWPDTTGRVWKTLTILRRIKYRYPAALALREHVFARDGHRCRRCGAVAELLLDHVISRRNGGSHHPGNLQTLCLSCNARKVSTEDRKAHAA